MLILLDSEEVDFANQHHARSFSFFIRRAGGNFGDLPADQVNFIFFLNRLPQLYQGFKGLELWLEHTQKQHATVFSSVSDIYLEGRPYRSYQKMQGTGQQEPMDVVTTQDTSINRVSIRLQSQPYVDTIMDEEIERIKQAEMLKYPWKKGKEGINWLSSALYLKNNEIGAAFLESQYASIIDAFNQTAGQPVIIPLLFREPFGLLSPSKALPLIEQFELEQCTPHSSTVKPSSRL